MKNEIKNVVVHPANRPEWMKGILFTGEFEGRKVEGFLMLGEEISPKLDIGAASMNLDLTNGYITVTHGTDGKILHRGPSVSGTWDKIWKIIKGEDSNGR